MESRGAHCQQAATRDAPSSRRAQDIPDGTPESPDRPGLAFTVTLTVVPDGEGRIFHLSPACGRRTAHHGADVTARLLWPHVLDDTEARRDEDDFAPLKPSRYAPLYGDVMEDLTG